MAAVHPVKTYIGLAKIGITSDTPISTADICAQMELSTELFEGTSTSSTPHITDIPFINSTLHIVKLSNPRCYCVCIDRDNNGVAVATWTNSAFYGWKIIPFVTPPQEYDLPLADGISTYGKSTYWKTQDCICFINIALYSTQPITTEFVVATLPAGFRPSVKVFAGGHGFSGIDTNVRVGIDVEVNPNGSILIWTETRLENVSGFIGFIADS